MQSKFLERLGNEVDGASLAVVRMITAGTLFVLATGVLITGRAGDLFMQLGIHFQYPLATFIKPLPGNLPYAHLGLIALTAAAVFVGWRTRPGSVLLCVASVYWFLLDPLYYTDGYYLLALMSILIAWLPVNRWMSADRQLGRETRDQVLGWQLWLVRMQLFAVYFFSGLSKLNGDWLSGAPLVERLADSNEMVGVELGVALAWSAMFFQLSIGFLLLWRRSRAAGLVLMTLFHALDFFWLKIGVAPVLVWAYSFVFCDPAWPRRVVNGIAPFVAQQPISLRLWSFARRVGSVIDSGFAWFDDSPAFKKRSPARKTAGPTKAVRTRKEVVTGEITKYCVVVWLAVQFLLPLRYLAYPGNPRWTNDGRLFAWWGDNCEMYTELNLSLLQVDRQILWSVNPKSEFPVPLRVIYSDQELEQRNLTDGMLQDIVLTNDDEIMNMRIKSANLSDADVQRLDAAALVLAKLQLTDFELRQMSRHPELLRQYCVYVSQTVGQVVPRRPQVRVELLASLNHRNWASYVPEETDLSDERFSLEPFRWIAPLQEPLPDTDQRLAFFQSQHTDWENNTFDSAPAGDRPKESEAVLAPGISNADEEWFQSNYSESAAVGESQ